MTDRQEAAWEAVKAAFIAVMGYGIEEAGVYSHVQAKGLMEEILPYSHTFSVTTKDVDGFKVAVIKGADDGCVNQGYTLAEAWAEGSTELDVAPYFYWEA